MKKIFSNKYFLAIWLVFVAVFNTILFLVTNESNKDLFNKPSFWVLYGCVMVLFVAAGLLTIVTNKDQTGQNLYFLLVLPIVLIGIILGTILFFFVEKIKVVFIFIPFIILVGLIVVAFILGAFYQKHLKSVKFKTVEVISMDGLKNYLNELLYYAGDNIVREVLNNLISKTTIVVKDAKNTELKALEKRIFEYALFLKKDLNANSVNNFLYNADQMEKLLEQRGSY